MSRAVLSSELLSRLRQATDSENDTHLGDPELYRALTSAVSETWEYITHGRHPALAETAVLLGFAVLIIRTRVKEG